MKNLHNTIKTLSLVIFLIGSICFSPNIYAHMTDGEFETGNISELIAYSPVRYSSTTNMAGIETYTSSNAGPSTNIYNANIYFTDTEHYTSPGQFIDWIIILSSLLIAGFMINRYKRARANGL